MPDEKLAKLDFNDRIAVANQLKNDLGYAVYDDFLITDVPFPTNIASYHRFLACDRFFNKAIDSLEG
ncbi:exicionase [Lactobacillus phage phig1e]|uniref:exicionase n=1 Tax=Lactobacillus phage phig1e TaxID=52979 RepID=UPI000009BA33|nr:exicionase [Lactobacillus phage phig1e]pir/T13181/ exicionase - Lactobacillus phage phi-gle [Lactobacillus phage phi-gle]CAA62091.1 gp66 [Lactobacillus phage phig1e]CAA66757.1 exicionase [Lactobacillus phage phig1e]